LEEDALVAEELLEEPGISDEMKSVARLTRGAITMPCFFAIAGPSADSMEP